MNQKISKNKIENISNPNFSTSESIATSKQQVKVWDVLVRFTHWAVAAGVIANLAFTEDGGQIHKYIWLYGGSISGLTPIMQGFIGTKYAQFSDFFPTETS